jgi:prepilin-type processing-associated H-X9-DG protein
MNWSIARTLRLIGYALAGVLTLGCFGLIVSPYFAPKRARRGHSCLGNIRQLSNAFLMYEEDCDRLAPAPRWMDALGGYVRSDSVLHCPAVAGENPYAYGYAMRSRLGGADVRSLKAAEGEPLIFDSWPLGRNAHTDSVLIPGFSRHGGQNIGYADGHCRLLPSANQTTG